MALVCSGGLDCLCNTVAEAEAEQTEESLVAEVAVEASPAEGYAAEGQPVEASPAEGQPVEEAPAEGQPAEEVPAEGPIVVMNYHFEEVNLWRYAKFHLTAEEWMWDMELELQITDLSQHEVKGSRFGSYYLQAVYLKDHS